MNADSAFASGWGYWSESQKKERLNRAFTKAVTTCGSVGALATGDSPAADRQQAIPLIRYEPRFGPQMNADERR